MLRPSRAGPVDDAADVALLARLARSGDVRAFETLYRRHTDVMYATALRITNDADLAADVVHDAWVRAVERAGRFEGRSAFRTWIVGIVVNLMREHRRRERHNDELDSDGQPQWDSTSQPAELEVAGVDPLDLEAAIAALPAGYRQILVLHDVEGFTHDEIATMLSIAPGTSKSQLARARHRVREVLANGVPRRSR
jgi:RNA polymerase sigma-70 factor (ECF subfamily)